MATRVVCLDLYHTLLESKDLKQYETNVVHTFNQLMIKAEIELSLKNIGQLFDRSVDRHVNDGFTIFEQRISEFLRRSTLVYRGKNMSPSGNHIVRNGTTQPNRVRTRLSLK